MGIALVECGFAYFELNKAFVVAQFHIAYKPAADGGPMDLSKFDGYREDGRTESSNTILP